MTLGDQMMPPSGFSWIVSGPRAGNVCKIREVSPLTGFDIAEVHQMADSLAVEWVTVARMSDSYRIKPATRTVYINGALTTDLYYRALREAFTVLGAAPPIADVIPLRPRKVRAPGTGTG